MVSFNIFILSLFFIDFKNGSNKIDFPNPVLFHPRDRERAKELTNKEFMTSLKPNSIIKREDEIYE